MLCQDCKKKPTCTQLCNKAEKYVSRDHVSLRESQQSNVAIDLLSYHLSALCAGEVGSFFSSAPPFFPFLSPLQNKILGMFYFDGMSRKQIAMRVNRRVTSVESHLSRARAKIRMVFSINGHIK